VIPAYNWHHCKSLFSVEIPHNVIEINKGAFYNCYCLRNVAIPANADVGYNIFIEEGMTPISDLRQLFGNSNARVIAALQHQCDRLTIHKLVYHLSYRKGVLQILITAINMTSGQRLTLNSILDPTGNEQLSSTCRMSACRFCCPNGDILCRVGDCRDTSLVMSPTQEKSCRQGVQNDTTFDDSQGIPDMSVILWLLFELKHKTLW